MAPKKADGKKGDAPVSPQARFFELTNALQPVRRAWLQASAAATGSCGYPFPVVSAIVLLARLGDGVQQSTLAEAVGVNPAAMLRTLDQAEAAGLCRRRDVPHNRRIKSVQLLPPGKALARKAEAQLNSLRAELLGSIELRDIETATRVLHTFEERIRTHLMGS